MRTRAAWTEQTTTAKATAEVAGRTEEEATAAAAAAAAGTDTAPTMITRAK
jgi:hypothetical protein